MLRYGAKLIVFTELLMVITIIVLYATNGAVLPTFVMLFLAPLLGGVIAGKLSKKSKKVLFNEKFNKYYIITNVILYILIYLFNFTFNIIMALIYGIGAIIGFLSSKKSIESLKNTIEYGQAENIFSETEKILVKNYKLEKFDAENIKKFLKMNNLEDNNYVLVQVMPTVKDYIVYGYFSLSKYSQYIVYFNDETLYFFELSKITNKSIENGFAINIKDIKVKKAKKGWIRYIIKIELKDGSKINMQIPKMVNKIYPQKQYSEGLFNKLKNTKENQI